MRNRCWGYDKNQVRVYFAALQSGHQRRLDQQEENRQLLEAAIEQQRQQLKQLEININISGERIKHLDVLLPIVKSLHEQIINTAQEQAVSILNEAKAQQVELLNTACHIDERIHERHQIFLQQIQAVFSLDGSN